MPMIAGSRPRRRFAGWTTSSQKYQLRRTCTRNNPARRLVSAIVLTAWLAEIPAERWRMLALRTAGHTLEEMAEEMNVSISNIFARCKRPGHALAERAGTWI